MMTWLRWSKQGLISHQRKRETQPKESEKKKRVELKTMVTQEQSRFVGNGQDFFLSYFGLGFRLFLSSIHSGPAGAGCLLGLGCMGMVVFLLFLFSHAR
jgi:hypothetical protein